MTHKELVLAVYRGLRRAINKKIYAETSSDMDAASVKFICGCRLHVGTSTYAFVYYNQNKVLSRIQVDTNTVYMSVFCAINDIQNTTAPIETIESVVRNALTHIPKIVSFSEMLLGLTQYNCTVYKPEWCVFDETRRIFVRRASLMYTYTRTENDIDEITNQRIYLSGAVSDDETAKPVRVLWEPKHDDLFCLWVSKKKESNTTSDTEATNHNE